MTHKKEKEEPLPVLNVTRKVGSDGGSLEIIDWSGEPAVLLDNTYILKRSVLIRRFLQYRKQGVKCDE